MLNSMVGAQGQPSPSTATLGNLGAGLAAPAAPPSPSPALGAVSPATAGATFPLAVGKDAFQPVRGAGTGYGALNTVYRGALDKAAPGMPSPTAMYSYLRSQGASPNEAMMLTGAAASESGFNYRASHDDDTGYGMFGHRLDRLAAMQRFAGTATPNWQQQAAFALQEVRSRPEAAMVANAKSPQDLAVAQMYFEQPQGFSRSNPMAGHNFNGRLNTLARFSQAFGGDASAPAQPVRLAQAGASDAPLPIPAGRFLAQRQAAKDAGDEDAPSPAAPAGALAQVAPPPNVGLDPAMAASPTAMRLMSQGVSAQQVTALQGMIRNPETRAQGWQIAFNLLKKEDPITQQKNLLELEKLTRDVRGPGYQLDMQGKALANQSAAQKLGERNIVTINTKDGPQSGYWDNGVLKPVGQPVEGKGTTGWENYQKYVEDQQKRGQPAMGFNDWGQQWKKAGATTIDMGDKSNQLLNKNIVDDIRASKSKAQGAVETLQAIQRQRDALDGGMVTGFGANWRVQARNALATALGIDDPAVINSQAFEAAAKQKGAQIAKSISNSGHTTNADLMIGQAIAGGDPSKAEAAIRSVIDMQEMAAKQTLAQHNASVDKFAKIVPGAADAAGWYRVDAPDLSRVPKINGGAPAASSARGLPPIKSPVRVSSPQDAMRLPRGTPLILPDGSPGVVP